MIRTITPNQPCRATFSISHGFQIFRMETGAGRRSVNWDFEDVWLYLRGRVPQSTGLGSTKASIAAGQELYK